MSSPYDFLAGHKVEVFFASWCPDCKRLDRVLTESGVAHEKIDNVRADQTRGSSDECAFHNSG